MTGGTGEHGFNVRLRDSQTKRDFDKQQTANPDANAIADHYIAEHKRREQEQAQREADEQRRTKERISEIKADERRRLRERLLAMAYDSAGATPKEQELVAQMIQSKCPESLGQPEIHLLYLGKLRALIGNV